jgi:hypothetical protein
MLQMGFLLRPEWQTVSRIFHLHPPASQLLFMERKRA